MVIKYVLHPGYVTSESDSDRHWITGTMLARLYKVKLGECIEEAYVHALGNRRRDSLIHLYPKKNGNYKLPEE